jgi:hypothetical protein
MHNTDLVPVWLRIPSLFPNGAGAGSLPIPDARNSVRVFVNLAYIKAKIGASAVKSTSFMNSLLFSLTILALVSAHSLNLRFVVFS